MKVLFVHSEDWDWEAVYVDGVLKAQGHSVPSWRVVEALGIEQRSIERDQDFWDKGAPLYWPLDGDS